MPGPFVSALWPIILKQAPTLLAAADALLANSRRKPAEATAASEGQALRQRIVELEQQQHALAALSKQLADQISALSVAGQATAVKARQAFMLAVAGVVLALVACVLAWLL